jgi:hypothetical protein
MGSASSTTAAVEDPLSARRATGAQPAGRSGAPAAAAARTNAPDTGNAAQGRGAAARAEETGNADAPNDAVG